MLNLEHFILSAIKKINKWNSKPTDFHIYLRGRISPLCLHLGKHFLICDYRQMEISVSPCLSHFQRHTQTHVLALLPSEGIWRCDFVCWFLTACAPCWSLMSPTPELYSPVDTQINARTPSSYWSPVQMDLTFL